MKCLEVVSLIVAFTLQSSGSQDGKQYEATISASDLLYESSSKQVIYEQPRIRKAAPTYKYIILSEQPAINSKVNSGFNKTFPQPFSNQQHSQQQQQQNFKFNSNSNQFHDDVSTVHNAPQYHYNQFRENSNYHQYQQQQPLRQHQQHQPQTATQQHQEQPPQQQQQQQYPPQSYGYSYPEPTPCQMRLDLANNNSNNYIVQSVTSQLDVPYKQIDDNPRLFKRLISKCDSLGQCEPQNAPNCSSTGGAGGGSDFHHQQVLKLSKVQIQPIVNKLDDKSKNQFAGSALTGIAAKAQMGVPFKMGTDIKDRRLFPYTEVAIPQYPHN